MYYKKKNFGFHWCRRAIDNRETVSIVPTIMEVNRKLFFPLMKVPNRRILLLWAEALRTTGENQRASNIDVARCSVATANNVDLPKSF